jgi:hypothetical protein
MALGDLALVSTFEGEYEDAEELVSGAESLALELGDGLGWVAYLKAQIALYQHRFDEARIWCERWLESARRDGSPGSAADALGKLGCIALENGFPRAAARMYRDGLEIRRGIAHWRAELDIDGLSAVAAARGDSVVAACLLGAADASFAANGYVREPFEAAVRTRTAVTLQVALGERAFEDAVAAGRAMTLESAVEYALSAIE